VQIRGGGLPLAWLLVHLYFGVGLAEGGLGFSTTAV